MADEQFPVPTAAPSPGGEFKPNIYPIMYWAIAFGAIAGLLLFLLSILAQFITLFWFPVFLVGLVWGGFRNYRAQKATWSQQQGVPPVPQSPMEEFRGAVNDIMDVSRTLVRQQQEEQAAAPEAAPAEYTPENPEEPPAAQPQPPAPPAPPVT